MSGIKMNIGHQCPWNGTIIGSDCRKCVASKVIYKEYIYCQDITKHCVCCKNASHNAGGYGCIKVECKRGSEFEWSKLYNHLIYDYQEPDEIVEF